jgi:hypothetical protein
MAQHERRCDQHGSDENPRYGRPRHPDCCQAHLAAVLPGVPAASVRATNVSPDSAGMLMRGHRLTPRQPVEYCKNRRELGIRCGQLVGYATQGPLLPCTQAHSRHLRQAVPSRCTRSGSLGLPFLTSSRRLKESSMVRAAVPAVGGGLQVPAVGGGLEITPSMGPITTGGALIAVASSARRCRITPPQTFPKSKSDAGPSSAASSTSTNEPHRNPSPDRWPSSETPQALVTEV